MRTTCARLQIKTERPSSNGRRILKRYDLTEFRSVGINDAPYIYYGWRNAARRMHARARAHKRVYLVGLRKTLRAGGKEKTVKNLIPHEYNGTNHDDVYSNESSIHFFVNKYLRRVRNVHAPRERYV